jgi:hypothetical protein
MSDWTNSPLPSTTRSTRPPPEPGYGLRAVTVKKVEFAHGSGSVSVLEATYF